ncbi:mitochondrial import inner membrane translocase subunit Tim23 isoform X2 [Anastrepha obliqua]|uniref:mitochondrial import inner membrane translocase subunit Tim23 isoform X2 n=1 Tax=Anastrepha ludens TaxID=28586 RepID=UPI0023B1492D|nr:mitochondrial import inner membrane translocase subunit Tim23 isoform X2 [Anastrepha ludens]XP_054744605.1 mitochondrial import inner membrane translocase subunit Tim23 isoform X2 [Anastrepha obliqua]
MSEDYLSQPLSLGSSSDEARTNRSSGVSSATSTFSTPISPYLNYDPRFLQQAQPEFIFPEGANKQRGRFELAFSQIGSSVMIGAGIGGLAGFYNGLQTSSALKQTGNLRRTQLLNHVMKQGSGTANTLGTLAVMYSAFGVLLQNVRGEDDDVNTLIAGTATGLLYKSTAGLRKCAIGGGIGLGISALYCLFQISRASSGGSGLKFL